MTLSMLFHLLLLGSFWNVGCNNTSEDIIYVDDPNRGTGGFAVGDDFLDKGPFESSPENKAGVGAYHFSTENKTLSVTGSKKAFHKVVRQVSAEINYFLSGPWMTIFVPSVYIVVVLVSLPLNILAIIIFLFKMKVKTPAVVFMLHLAIADVSFVLTLPFNIVYRFSGNDWLLGEAMCRFVITLFYCNMYCSILLMMGISVDRFLAIVYPMQSRTLRTVKRAWICCLSAWLVSIAGTVPLMINDLTAEIRGRGITTCFDTFERKQFKGFFIYYFMTFIIVLFFIPSIITLSCYIAIIRNLSTQKNVGSFDKSRAVVLSVIVLCEFVICFGPTNVIFFIHSWQTWQYLSATDNQSLYLAYFLCISISTISCCLDPILYYYVSPECKKYLCSLLCCKRDKGLAVPSPVCTHKEQTEESLLRGVVPTQ